VGCYCSRGLHAPVAVMQAKLLFTLLCSQPKLTRQHVRERRVLVEWRIFIAFGCY
jgi:hypothetical protein